MSTANNVAGQVVGGQVAEGVEESGGNSVQASLSSAAAGEGTSTGLGEVEDSIQSYLCTDTTSDTIESSTPTGTSSSQSSDSSTVFDSSTDPTSINEVNIVDNTTTTSDVTTVDGTSGDTSGSTPLGTGNESENVSSISTGSDTFTDTTAENGAVNSYDDVNPGDDYAQNGDAGSGIEEDSDMYA